MATKIVRIDPFRGFEPLPTQRRFLSWHGKYPDLRLLSSGYGGGKSSVGCLESIRHTIGYPHSRHLVSRYHYPDLADTTMVTFFATCERVGLNDGSKPGPRHYVFRRNPQPEIDWWNGSVTLFRNLDDATGSKYGSLELSTAFVDEGSEVPDEVMYVLYPSRLRWHLPGCQFKDRAAEMIARGIDPSTVPCRCPRRLWVCTNPGPSGFLRDVVDGKFPAERAAHFPVPPGENIYAGPDYFETLDRIGKMRGAHWHARFVMGSWDAFEGQRFTMLERESHILEEDFTPSQAEWDIYEGHDFGYRVAHGIVWVAVHRGGEYPPVVVDCYEQAEREIPDIAQDVLDRRRLHGWDSQKIVAVGDPAGNSRSGQTGLTDIMIFAKHGVEIVPMHRAKEPGPRADLLALMFSRKVTTRAGRRRGLSFCPRAALAFERCLRYRYRERSRTSVDDAPERFVKRDDHLVDALGYAVSALPDPLEEDTGPSEEWLAEVRARRLPTLEELDRIELSPRRL